MATPNLAHHNQLQLLNQQRHQNPAYAKERVQQIIQRANVLRSQGFTPDNNPELANLIRFITNLQSQQAQQSARLIPQEHPNPDPSLVVNGHPSLPQQAQPTLNGRTVSPQSSLSSSSFPTNPPHPGPPTTPVSFTPEQINVLRAQIHAFKTLQRGQPVSVELQNIIRPPQSNNPEFEKLLSAQLVAKVADNTVKVQKASSVPPTPAAPETQPPRQIKMPRSSLKDVDPDAPLHPYNAYLHPFTHLKVVGLDPHQLINERRRFVEARIQQRIRELEAMSSTIGDGGLEPIIDDESKENVVKLEHGVSNKAINLDYVHPPTSSHGKLRAVIELRSLRVLDKQRALRAVVAERLTHGSLLPLNRSDFRRVRKPAMRDTHMTENLERKQRVDRERRAKQKHDRVIRLGKAVLSFHTHAEREEQKHDEEAYMKLIDTAKDTRITHLLKQTDSYLDSLAQAVMAQQSENPIDVVEEATSEETFGAHKSFDDPQEDKGKIDYYAVAHRIKERVTKQPALLIGGTLKDYQLKGLQWMVSLYNNRLNGILADEMGLGKTIQTISLVSFLIEVKKQRGPYLVVVPLSTMTNWSGEFAKWAPATELRVNQFQVLLTTYEYIIKDRPFLSKMKWIHMIIDEGHRMKNTQSKLAQTLTTYYHSRYRLILTGTPLQNNLPELWSLLNFSFDEWFNTPFANSGTPDKIELNEEEALLIIRRLHKVLRPFLLRRLKKDVEAELPDKVEKVVKVKMSALQAQLYKQMKKYKMIADGNDKPGKPGGVKGLSNELMQLRKICQHPFLFENVEDKLNPGNLVDDKIVRTSGKIELLSRILPKFFATGHRVLIFFQMTKVMDIMEDFLKMMGWKYLRLDGGTKTDERAGHVQLFNAKDSDITVFILSTRAGGLGLNLQTADTVIIFDSDWNPHADLQAQDRAHRIGQTKSVRILRFITEKSVEEAMYARARYKLDIDDKVIQAGRFDNKSTQEEQEEFLRSILEADQEEENEEAGDMNDEEINEIIARSDEEARLFSEMDMQRERDAVANWRAAGNRGRPPPPLISLEELPDCYRTDEPFETKDDIEEAEGRGHRRRAVINYNDGLSDDQWAMALEEGEDIQQLSEQARLKQARRTAKLESGTGTPMSEGGRGRGRKGKARVNEVDFEPVNGKRKRGLNNNSMSVTPSVMDEEEDDRDMKRRKVKILELPTAVKERMKKAFNECYKAIMNCTDENGRKRCDLFREPPDKREYPDYYRIIASPIALSHIRKRINTNQYKTVTAFRDDVRLMFTNARTYNQEGSWVYVDAVEMEKVFDAAYVRHVSSSGLPGVDMSLSVAGGGGLEEALTPMDEDREEGRLPSKSKSGRKQIVSDDEYLTPSDDD
ncbi:P-loop containing nucleoside triphosphate hydrolase protein [Russula vinacea]|nr:P-loop containing nucleoside triphosphate hydrolase protein [Russula vinacea]